MNYTVKRTMYLPNGRKAEVIIVKDYNGNIVDWYAAKARKPHNVVRDERKGE